MENAPKHEDRDVTRLWGGKRASVTSTEGATQRAALRCSCFHVGGGDTGALKGSRNPGGTLGGIYAFGVRLVAYPSPLESPPVIVDLTSGGFNASRAKSQWRHTWHHYLCRTNSLP